MNETADFKIVLLHEDFVSGLRASSVLERLADQLELDAGQLQTEIWKFEQLIRPKVRAQAIAPLLQARMIIVSAAGNVDLPEHIKEIIENALCLRRDHEAAIVALLDWELGARPGLPKVGRYLRDLAVRMRLDFFCNKGEWQPHVDLTGQAESCLLADNFAPSDESFSRDA